MVKEDLKRRKGEEGKLEGQGNHINFCQLLSGAKPDKLRFEGFNRNRFEDIQSARKLIVECIAETEGTAVNVCLNVVCTDLVQDSTGRQKQFSFKSEQNVEKRTKHRTLRQPKWGCDPSRPGRTGNNAVRSEGDRKA